MYLVKCLYVTFISNKNRSKGYEEALNSLYAAPACETCGAGVSVSMATGESCACSTGSLIMTKSRSIQVCVTVSNN